MEPLKIVKKSPDSIAATSVKKWPRIPASLHLLLCLSVLALAAPAMALNIPEKLVYELSWSGITAGTATQEIFEDQGVVRILSTARSSAWISVFFPVDDRIEGTLAKAAPPLLGLPLTFRLKISEGKHKRDREITFDHAQRKAHYVDHLGKDTADIEISSDTYDTYSSFFYVRTLPLEVGKSVFVTILDNKQLWKVEVQVLKKERISTDLGEFNTILIKPLIKSEGIFQRKGEVYIWLTDDEKRVPIRMRTKVTIGSITATLVGGKY